MAGGSARRHGVTAQSRGAAMEPGLMAGGSAQAMTMKDGDDVAAMEPRPDVRGKADLHPTAPPYETWPQWSPGLMAGGS
ncbi:hypothetical protein [Candidatus Microthrix parvicella]